MLIYPNFSYKLNLCLLCYCPLFAVTVGYSFNSMFDEAGILEGTEMGKNKIKCSLKKHDCRANVD